MSEIFIIAQEILLPHLLRAEAPKIEILINGFNKIGQNGYMQRVAYACKIINQLLLAKPEEQMPFGVLSH